MPRRSLPARPNVVWRLFVVDNLAAELMLREFREAGLTPRGFGVLSTIGSTGTITPTDLAELLGMPPTTLSAVLKRLEGDGLVRRRPNPDDRRSVLLELTDAGRGRMQAAAPALGRTVDGVAAHLDVPLEQLQDALEAYERALRRALDSPANSQ